MDRSRVEELSAEESRPEVDVDGEGGHLRVGQRELHPAVVEDLPVAVLQVLEGAHEVGVDRRLQGDLALSPGHSSYGYDTGWFCKW